MSAIENVKNGKPPPEERQIGAHLIRLEAPDLSIATIVGDLSGDEMAQIVEIVTDFCRDRPRVFSITDMSRMGVMSTEAKKHLKRFPYFNGLAILGASVQLRLVMQVLSKAYSLMNRKEAPMVFVVGLPEARELIEKWRAVAQKS